MPPGYHKCAFPEVNQDQSNLEPHLCFLSTEKAPGIGRCFAKAYPTLSSANFRPTVPASSQYISLARVRTVFYPVASQESCLKTPNTFGTSSDDVPNTFEVWVVSMFYVLLEAVRVEGRYVI
jgi:hypothetical protein